MAANSLLSTSHFPETIYISFSEREEFAMRRGQLMYSVEFLRSRHIWFESLPHRPAATSTKRAQNAHVPGRYVAKTVLLKVGDRLTLAVLPSTMRIDLAK